MTTEIKASILEVMKRSPWQCWGLEHLYDLTGLACDIHSFSDELTELTESTVEVCCSSDDLEKLADDDDFTDGMVGLFDEKDRTVLESSQVEMLPFVRIGLYSFYVLTSSYQLMFEPAKAKLVKDPTLIKDPTYYTLTTPNAWKHLYDTVMMIMTPDGIEEFSKKYANRAMFASILMDRIQRSLEKRDPTAVILPHIRSFQNADHRVQALFGYALAGPYVFDPLAPDFKKAPKKAPKKPHRIKRTPVILI